MLLTHPVFLEPFFLTSIAIVFAVGAVMGGAAALTMRGRKG